MRNILLSSLLTITSFLYSIPSSYNVIWNEQSVNSSESMPCGGGDIGMNVWVENGELLFYLSRSGTFDENNVFVKLGRVRIKCTPNPFEGAQFKQELHLQEGYISIEALQGKEKYRFELWADVNEPLVYVDFMGSKPLTVEARYESWRHEELIWNEPGRVRASIAFRNAPMKGIVRADSIRFNQNAVEWVHLNRPSSIWDISVEQQGLGDYKSILWNPLRDAAFGGIMFAKGMKPVGKTAGVYTDTPFQAWSIKSTHPTKKQTIEIVLVNDSVQNIEQWRRSTSKLCKELHQYAQLSKKESRNWWKQFWSRSYIVINSDKADKGYEVGRNYQLFRYQLGCNRIGKYPTKFNGGLFTYDPSLVKDESPFTPDHRDWGGGTHTAQNQRLLYWPLLKSGDIDLMFPQIEFYRRSLANAEVRTKHYWGHNGASFTEQIDQWGLPMMGSYGWDRPADLHPGIEHNRWVEHQWDTSLEFCLMALEMERYDNTNITPYLPLIESCLTFFDEHYQYQSRIRGFAPLDENGCLIIYPGTACETYKGAYNPSSTIAALLSVTTRLLELPKTYLSESRRKHWEEFLKRIPPIPFRECNGHKTIAPALAWMRISNYEIPQLYPVYPWGLYGVGLPDLDVAINTWKHGVDRDTQFGFVSWHQDPIFCARLGLTKEAQELTIKKLENAPRRFPTFWGPGHDWVPDHNWGGSGMIALQEMLIQTPGEKIILFPAWPIDWDVSFRLHVPYQTTIEGELRNGKIISLRVAPESRRKDIIFPNELQQSK